MNYWLTSGCFWDSQYYDIYESNYLIIFLLFFSKVYSVFSNTLNIQHCGIHCAFDSDNKCDYFSLQNQHCYLYNFNSGTSGNWHGYSYDMYIYKGMYLLFFACHLCTYEEQKF